MSSPSSLDWYRRSIGERRKLAVSFGSYNSPRLLDVAQGSRLSMSGDLHMGCRNVVMAVGVNHE